MDTLTQTAPERIWLSPDHHPFRDWKIVPRANPLISTVPYIRADLAGQWKPITEAPKNKPIVVYAWDARGIISPEYKEDYPPVLRIAQWHPDAGFCVCDLREPTHYFDFGTVTLPTAPQAEAEEGK